MDLFPLSLVLLVNLVLHSPRSLRSHHQPHLVLLPMLLLNSQPHGSHHSDGSVSTESGIVSESGTSFTTITTFPPPTTSSDITTEFTTTWKSPIVMDLFQLNLVLLVNLVLHSPLSLRSHHQPHQCCCRCYY